MTLKLVTGAAVAILSAVFGGTAGAQALAMANSAPLHAHAQGRPVSAPQGATTAG